MARSINITIKFTAEEIRNIVGVRGTNHLAGLSDTQLLATARRIETAELSSVFSDLLARELGFWTAAEEIAKGSRQKQWLAYLTSQRGLDRSLYCAGSWGNSTFQRISSFLERLWLLGYDVEHRTGSDGSAPLFLVDYDPQLVEPRSLAQDLCGQTRMRSAEGTQRDQIVILIEALDAEARRVLAAMVPHLNAFNRRNDIAVDACSAVEAAKAVAVAGTAEFVLHKLPTWCGSLVDLIAAGATT